MANSCRRVDGGQCVFFNGYYQGQAGSAVKSDVAPLFVPPLPGGLV